MAQQRIVIIAGPSGSGKDTIIAEVLAARPDIRKTVSHTTRLMRPGERDGVEYHFVEVEEFRRMIAEDAFLEWAQFPPGTGDYYGTAKSEVRPEGTTLLKVELQGVRSMKRLYPETIVFFIAPPTIESLRARILGRGDMDEGRLLERLQRAEEEMREGPGLADHVVVNRDGEEGLRRAVNEILTLLGE